MSEKLRILKKKIENPNMFSDYNNKVNRVDQDDQMPQSYFAKEKIKSELICSLFILYICFFTTHISYMQHFVQKTKN